MMPTSPKLLIVDDEPQFAAMLENLFKSFGYSVSTAGDEPSAMQVVREVVPDCMILDIRLEKGDGLSILRNIRRFDHEDPRLEEHIRSIPVIILTATGVGMKSLFELEGANAFFEKPFDSKMIHEEIQKLIRR